MDNKDKISEYMLLLIDMNIFKIILIYIKNLRFLLYERNNEYWSKIIMNNERDCGWMKIGCGWRGIMKINEFWWLKLNI